MLVRKLQVCQRLGYALGVHVCGRIQFHLAQLAFDFLGLRKTRFPVFLRIGRLEQGGHGCDLLRGSFVNMFLKKCTAQRCHMVSGNTSDTDSRKPGCLSVVKGSTPFWSRSFRIFRNVFQHSSLLLAPSLSLPSSILIIFLSIGCFFFV